MSGRKSSLLTAEEAAAIVGVRPSTIAKWVQRGKLAPVMLDGRRHLYAEDEVLDCERQSRRNAGGPRQRVSEF